MKHLNIIQVLWYRFVMFLRGLVGLDRNVEPGSAEATAIAKVVQSKLGGARVVSCLGGSCHTKGCPNEVAHGQLVCGECKAREQLRKQGEAMDQLIAFVEDEETRQATCANDGCENPIMSHNIICSECWTACPDCGVPGYRKSDGSTLAAGCDGPHCYL